MHSGSATPPTSCDEKEIFIVYSTTVHEVVVMINAAVIGLLQLPIHQSSASITHKPRFICFCLFVILYAFLRVREAIYVRQRFGFAAKLVGKTSHLFGGLSALVLISIGSTCCASILLLLWLCWFSVAAYNTFNDVNFIYSFLVGSPHFKPV